MTEVLDSIAQVNTLASTRLRYEVAMPDPASHLFEITLHCSVGTDHTLDLKLPVWTPGSYLVREYAKHLQDFSAVDDQEAPVSWQKISKNHWQIQSPEADTVKIHYRIFAHELTVRTNHLDASHGYFNPGAMFFYVPGREQDAIAITIHPPDPTWQVTTALDPLPDQPLTFLAKNFDTLVDSPFEIGTHQIYDFETLEKPHQLAIWGAGNYDAEQIIGDTKKIIEVEAKLFGGLPYDRYFFLLHVSAKGYGGLEHHNCCSLLYSRFGFRKPDSYNRFMGLVAHEFFHLWNVKRLRPQALHPFDYDQENYTDALWFCEGVTSFYDLILPYRAGIYDAKFYLKLLSESITRLQSIPGRHTQSLTESSFDTWIKLYRPHANSRNCQVSYYLKGEIVSLLLDLQIRQQHQNQRSLDDVMLHLWQTYGQKDLGYSREQLLEGIESIAEMDLTQFWQKYLDGTVELPYEEFLNPFGLEVVADFGESPFPYHGLTLSSQSGKTLIKFVDIASPAQMAGLQAGDELLALDGFRVQADQLEQRFQDYQRGDAVSITLFHDDQLTTHRLTLSEPRPKSYRVQPITTPTDQQRTNFRQWLGIELVELT
ncbi:M61 family metallopeptidase [Acaryochloris sp. 'Moss Beach']|uniref:M61 family metallopeptidase n=1 Tax=Acaryochloris sp. 'Moss Beach' TaxID=2740837 RepID=UPI001F40B229|nr:M61 family metallopeptidase [Acaryochloris sp. 'Moss Beach']UJB70974.1 M61 family metallopeptidase [Acaryochloris sp. 'Moss Beach']